MVSQSTCQSHRSVLAEFLIRCCPEREHKKFASGETLFEENTPASGSHVIETGNVELSIVCSDGSRAVVESVGPGSLIGVSAAFGEHEYVFTARALSDTETIYVPRQQVVQLFESHPDMRMLILDSLSRSVQVAIRMWYRQRTGAPTRVPHSQATETTRNSRKGKKP